ncbi:hypothetical protein NL676_034622 [Syzygium grande]|nr:hypothetical protein NL676_034622 [Syzygium grande]
MLLVSIICLLRKHGNTSKKAPVLVENPPRIDHPMISFQELCSGTNNFSESNLLGAGSFNSIYKGTLANGTDIAVKVLNLHIEGALKSFDAKCEVFCKIRHRNLVKVINTCTNADLRALILAENKLETQTQTLGMIGYIAPKYGSEGKVSKKGDVYSFGILLLEVITRKKPTGEMFNANMSLRRWVGAAIPDRVLDIMDSELLSTKHEDLTLSELESIVLSILELGLECSKDLPKERIGMETVMVKLNKIKLSLP